MLARTFILVYIQSISQSIFVDIFKQLLQILKFLRTIAILALFYKVAERLFLFVGAHAVVIRAVMPMEPVKSFLEFVFPLLRVLVLRLVRLISSSNNIQ